MTFRLSRRSRSKLVGVHSDLVLVVQRALALTEVDFAVTEGVRSERRQAELVRAGLSKTLNSKHLEQAETGLAHAVDVMAVGDLDRDGDVDAVDVLRTWDRELYGKIAIAMKASAIDLGVSIRWGGDFKNWYDGPHFELV